MSGYIDEQTSVVNRRNARSFLVSLMVTILSIGLLSFGTLASPSNPTVQSADAKAISLLCGGKDDLGLLGQRDYRWRNFIQTVPAPDASSRRWTLQEAYGSFVPVGDYTGEGGKDQDLVRDVGTDRGKGIGNYEEAMPKLEKVRTVDNCMFATALTTVSTNMFALSSTTTAISSALVTMVFDSSVICRDANTNNGKCFNLLKVIGGSNKSDGGLIGALTGGLYFPMLSLVALAMALWMGYIGIVKRKYREALQGLGWTVVSVIAGIALLVNPQIIAKAPMAVSNTVGACVIGAFSGTGCGDTQTDTTQDEYTSDVICRSSASGLTLDEKMSLATNSLSCQMWKAFVLEPWSNANFGVPFRDMDVKNPKAAAAIKKAGFKEEDFCVPLKSDLSADKQPAVLQMNDSAKVCNVAAYQLYLKTSATGAPNSVDKEGTKLDENWYKVILVAASDNDYWDAWSLSIESGMGKAGGAFTSLFASIFGSILIILVAGLAFIYLLKSMILMAFAPFFALVGIQPGRGRKLLIGFLESVVSNVLKYIASAIFLVIALSIYGAVLGGVANVGLTLIFVMLMGVALWMYRSEIIELIGKSNMGGQKMSSSFGDYIEKSADRAKRLGVATTGGAIGGALANGGNGEMAASVWSGAKGSMKRDLKRGRGTLASVVKERDRALADNKRDLGAIAGRENEQAKVLRERLDQGTDKIAEKRNEFVDLDRRVHDAEDFANNVDRKEAAVQKVEANVLHRMAQDGRINPDFAQYMKMGSALQMLEARRRVAEGTGDTATANDLQNKMNLINARRDQLAMTFRPETLRSMENEYQNELSEEMSRNDLADYEPRSNEYIDARVGLKRAEDDRERARQEFESMTAGFAADQEEYIKRKTVAEALQERHTSLNSGDGITKSEIDREYQKASARGSEEGRATVEEINLWSKDAVSSRPDSSRQFIDPTVVQTPEAREHGGRNESSLPPPGASGPANPRPSSSVTVEPTVQGETVEPRSTEPDLPPLSTDTPQAESTSDSPTPSADQGSKAKQSDDEFFQGFRGRSKGSTDNGNTFTGNSPFSDGPRRGR